MNNMVFIESSSGERERFKRYVYNVQGPREDNISENVLTSASLYQLYEFQDGRVDGPH